MSRGVRPQTDQKNPGQDKHGGLAVLGGMVSSVLSARVLQRPVHPKLETVPGGSHDCLVH